MKCPDDFIRALLQAIQNMHGDLTFTDSVAEQIEYQLRNEFGGREIYIQKIDREARRDSILREFNGRNRQELCAKYGLSKAQFYRWIKGN